MRTKQTNDWLCRRAWWVTKLANMLLFFFLIIAVDFIHRNFSKFILNADSANLFGAGANANAMARRNLLTELLLELILVNGTPLMDITIDLSPKNSTKYIGVIRVPQRSGLLPQLVTSKNAMAMLNKWVSTPIFNTLLLHKLLSSIRS